MNLIKYILKLIIGLGMLVCSVMLILVFLLSIGETVEEFESHRLMIDFLVTGTLGFGGATFYFFVVDYHYKVYKKDEEEQKN